MKRQPTSPSTDALTRRTAVAALAAAPLATPAMAAGADPTLRPVPGAPKLDLGTYSLEALGYAVEEFFLEGAATSYRHVGEAGADGAWRAEPGETRRYVTRIVVVRPVDPARFNGSVLVEWLNVSAGRDAAADWNMAHRHMMRDGFAYVGVSAQRVGVEGGAAGVPGSLPLKAADPVRYARLSHPGDAFSFDIFTQAARAVAAPGAQALRGLKPRRMLALGESQSAGFLTTYINAVDPLAQVFDGFFVHSRFGGAPRLAAASPTEPLGREPLVRFRPDLRVPLMVLITENDLLGRPGQPGYFPARQPDHARLRVWEVPGTAHADNYIINLWATDSGKLPITELAAGWRPSPALGPLTLAKAANASPAHHYVTQAALRHLDCWVGAGHAPPHGDPIAVDTDGPAPVFRLDAHGNAQRGVRTPWLDAPTARHSGYGNSGFGFIGDLVGVTEPFTPTQLASIYPGGRREYLTRFTHALDEAVDAGFVLRADVLEILALAEALWPKG
jgi:hypothetical protein